MKLVGMVVTAIVFFVPLSQAVGQMGAPGSGMMGPGMMGGMMGPSQQPGGQPGPGMMGGMMPGMMGGMMGGMMPGMMGGMPGIAMPPHVTPARAFINFAQELSLTDEQVDRLARVDSEVRRELIMKRARMVAAELDLWDRMHDATTDLSKVREQVREAAEARADFILTLFGAAEKAKEVLTREQREKAAAMARRLGIGGMRGFRGAPGGPGGMMGPRSEEQGGAIRASAEPYRVVTAELPVTQTKAAAEVTVAATFLNLKGEGSADRLLFQVSLDTHSVSLDGYKLKEISVLRDPQGNEYSALALSSPSGGGHHLGGVLEFPGKDGRGKSLIKGQKYIELVIKNVAGVKERTFRWELPGS